jgi:peptide/nickel transport system substrate-binding protein
MLVHDLLVCKRGGRSAAKSTRYSDLPRLLVFWFTSCQVPRSDASSPSRRIIKSRTASVSTLRTLVATFLLIFLLCAAGAPCAASGPGPPLVLSDEELQLTDSEIGRYGGKLTTSLRSEPKTLNPVSAVDAPSRKLLALTNADLIHIDRYTQGTEPALAKSWRVSSDGRRFTLQLRRGMRFSDGQPFDADDVVFTFQVFLDEKIRSPQRDLLVIGGKPIAVQKIDAYTVQFETAQPDAAAERLFDSIAVLPRHLLEKAYRDGTFDQAWDLTVRPDQIAGLGPFRLKEYVPGQRIVLGRNPYYWKVDRRGNRLPYLDEVAFLVVPSEEAEVIRFQAGDTDLISGLSPENFAVLAKEQKARGYELYDRGPALQYEFLFFNLNELTAKSLSQLARKQKWFELVNFRQAVSAAIDREAIIRLVYQGRASPLWAHVTPGNKLWVNSALLRPPRSLQRARELLTKAGFSWKPDGTLTDGQGKSVDFSIATTVGNTQRAKMAAIVQDDLAQLGMQVHIVPLEFGSLMNRIFQTFDYEACVLGLVSGDADPNPEINVWLSSGATHLWDLSRGHPETAWQAEIDRLMVEQLMTLNYKDRKRSYDRVQELVAENLPLICLVSPNILVGAKNKIGNFRPANLNDYTLWNVEQLFFR